MLLIYRLERRTYFASWPRILMNQRDIYNCDRNVFHGASLADNDVYCWFLRNLRNSILNVEREPESTYKQ
jgi:hypothetical protein